MAKTALIIGATGLTGRHLLLQLLEHPAYERVVALVRKPSGLQHPKLSERLFDFERPNPDLVEGEDVFCALGTTLAKAGSKPAQYKIDCSYPTELGRLARSKGAKRYLLVSSIGANARSGNFYLRTKGELEENIRAMGFETFVAARPSFLLGDRQELRIGERIGIVIARLIAPLMVGAARKYRGIEAAQVAKALIAMANDGRTGSHFPEYDALIQV